MLPAPRADETLPRRRRIAERRDFQLTYDAGAKRHGRFVVAFARAGAAAEARLGITVTKKVGDATLRNLLKRRVREMLLKLGVKPPSGLGDA